MATRTWTLSKDTIVAGGAVDMGNANDAHAPIGLYSGWIRRYLAKYNVDTSGMASIESAVWHGRSTTQVHVAFGSSPTIEARRITGSWDGTGGSEGSYTTSADPKWSTKPATTTSGMSASTNMTESESTWDTVTVTGIAQAWLAGETNRGIEFRAADEGTTNDGWEVSAQASSYDSYIVVTYTPTSTEYAPTATPVAPLAGEVAPVAYQPGEGWASPRVVLSWEFSDPNAGAAQSAYQVVVTTDADAAFYDSGKTTSSATSATVPMEFTEGAYYKWTVTVWDNTDRASAALAVMRFRVRFGKAEYVGDLGAAPAEWSLSDLDTTGSVVVEYNSSTNTADPGAGLGTWQAALASVTKQRYLRYRVWLLPGTTAPSFNRIEFLYSTAVAPTPDNWVLSANAANTVETKVYGTRSLRISATGTEERTSQSVTVRPDTQYQLSGRIRQASGAGAFIALGSSATAGELVRADGSPTSTDWAEVSVPWFSGSLTSVYVQCGSVDGDAWFDALQLEASNVVTPWSPSMVAEPVGVDASGIRIDASVADQPGSLRLRGSDGGVRDIVELGASGLTLGGDIDVATPYAKVLSFGDVGLYAGGTSFPTEPVVGMRYFRTDLNMEFIRVQTGVVFENYATAAQGATADASSTYLTFTASRAIDVNDGTEWASQTSPSTSWLRVDLGAARTVTSFRLVQSSAANNAAASYKIQWSDDNAAWTDVYTQSTQVTDSGSVAISGGTHRYWRALGLTNAGGGGWSVYTFSVSGTTSGVGRWLSSTQYAAPLQRPSFTALASTATDHARLAVPDHGHGDLWLEEWIGDFNVASGGSALSGTNKWVGTLRSRAADGTTFTTHATFNIDSGSSGVYRKFAATIDAVVSSNTRFLFASVWTKSGAPGALSPYEMITYRVVAT